MLKENLFSLATKGVLEVPVWNVHSKKSKTTHVRLAYICGKQTQNNKHKMFQ